VPNDGDQQLKVLMMKMHKFVLFGVALATALLLSIQTASAATIIKLDLGDDPLKDFEFVSGTLSTIADGIGSPGDQETGVDFLDFLSGEVDIPSGASYTFDGAVINGPAFVAGPAVTQFLMGGSFQLWDDDGVTLLLDVAMTDSVLFGATNTGAAATIAVDFGNVVGGTLAPQILSDTISFSISMAGVKTGALNGLRVIAGVLQDFQADATKIIAAEQVPEPTVAALSILGLAFAATAMRRRS
jgi:hypothetical protein